MNSLIIRPETDEELETWVGVFGTGQRRHESSAWLTLQEMKDLVRSGHVSLDSLLVGYRNGIPTTAARFIHSSRSPTGFITDFVVIPGKRQSSSDVVVELLRQARANRLEKITSWVPDYASDFSDSLSTFTFEPYRIHQLMRNLLFTEPECDDAAEVAVELISEKHALESIPSPIHDERSECLSLFELRDLLSLKWKPTLVGRFADEEEPRLICYVGKNQRVRGLIKVLQNSDDSESMVNLVQASLLALHKRGVRDVQVQTSIDERLKRPLVRAGFEREITLFEISMFLYYS